MMITFDPAKRDWTLKHRGLDFADALAIFAGKTATAEDTRHDYGESRFLTAGYLGKRMVVVVWTPRGADRHVISMRLCHAKEENKWRAIFDEKASGG